MAWTKVTLLAYQGADLTAGFTGYDDDTSYFFGANEWLFDYNDTVSGNNYAGDLGSSDRFVTMTLVPEPSTLALLAFAALPFLRRNRR